jgi:hypothetical protein
MNLKNLLPIKDIDRIIVLIGIGILVISSLFSKGYTQYGIVGSYPYMYIEIKEKVTGERIKYYNPPRIRLRGQSPPMETYTIEEPVRIPLKYFHTLSVVFILGGVYLRGRKDE